jgi:hypothetical protein
MTPEKQDKLRMVLIDKFGPDLGNERADKIINDYNITQAEKKQFEKKEWDKLKLVEVDGYVYVPRIPIPITPYHIEKLIEGGAIPLKDLVDQQWYFGNHRCCRLAQWDGKEKIFRYYKNSFGVKHLDTCYHFEMDDNFALFVPIRKATDAEIIEEKTPL